jgi:hypothetical protein
MSIGLSNIHARMPQPDRAPTVGRLRVAAGDEVRFNRAVRHRCRSAGARLETRLTQNYAKLSPAPFSSMECPKSLVGDTYGADSLQALQLAANIEPILKQAPADQGRNYRLLHQAEPKRSVTMREFLTSRLLMI